MTWDHVPWSNALCVLASSVSPHRRCSSCGECSSDGSKRSKRARACPTLISYATSQPVRCPFSSVGVSVRESLPSNSITTTDFDAFPSEKKEHFGVMAALIKKSLPVTLPTDITPQEIMHICCLVSLSCSVATILLADWLYPVRVQQLHGQRRRTEATGLRHLPPCCPHQPLLRSELRHHL